MASFKDWMAEAVKTHHLWRQNEIPSISMVQNAIRPPNGISSVKLLRRQMDKQGISLDKLSEILGRWQSMGFINIDGDNIVVHDRELNDPAARDALGKPSLMEPGFTKGDRHLIRKSKEEVEDKLNKATSRLGIHWLLMYLEPVKGTPEVPYPERGGQGEWKRRSAGDWNSYDRYARKTAMRMMSQFKGEVEAGNLNKHPDEKEMIPDPNNTIVYVKPTSRVHALNDWQQLHNIAHAVWGQARKQLSKFVKMLQDLINRLQKSHYDSSKQNANWVEIVVMLGRLLDVKSYQRIFSLGKDQNLKGADTALNNFMEAMFELIAVYLNNGGKIPLRPREQVLPGKNPITKKPTYPTPGRKGQMEPVQGITQFAAAKVKPWAWQPTDVHPETNQVVATDEDYRVAADGLARIIDEALRECVYAKVGPIYATKGYFTTQP